MFYEKVISVRCPVELDVTVYILQHMPSFIRLSLHRTILYESIPSTLLAYIYCESMHCYAMYSIAK